MKSSGYKSDRFDNRLESQVKAKNALLEKFLARPGPDDPAVAARRAERAAIEAAREIRHAERKIAREAEAAAKLAAEQAALEEARIAKEAELIARKAEAAERATAAKAARDARYAARRAKRR
jgi:Na+/phosphate symporter